MPQTATSKGLPAALAVLQAMQAEGVAWGEDDRAAARRARAARLDGRMAETIDRHLERMAEVGAADRRNGADTRWLFTEVGMIELAVPRARTFSARKVVCADARRAKAVDRMILACFLLGLSSRKVARALLPILGRPVSPATVSAVARQLNGPIELGRGAGDRRRQGPSSRRRKGRAGRWLRLWRTARNAAGASRSGSAARPTPAPPACRRS
jgi:Transposase, Mutator family